MSIDTLKNEIAEKWKEDPPLVELCSRIVDFMVRLSPNDLRMLTFTSFLNATEKKEIDSQLLKALAVLVGSSHAILESHAMLVDDDDTEHEISAEDWAHARETGQLVHPSTGILVPDFESKVFPFFVPSAYFQSVVR